MRIEADRERCTSAGMCALTAPDVFDQDTDDGRVLILTDRIEPESAIAVEQAVALCPSAALRLVGEPSVRPERSK